MKNDASTKVSVRYERVVPALTSRQWSDDTVVASFRGSGGERYDVRAGEVSCFAGLSPASWPAAARAGIIEALCRHVEQAPLSSQFPGAIDLRARFSAASAATGARVEGPGSVADAVRLWRSLRRRFHGAREWASVSALLGVDPERLRDAQTDPDVAERPGTRLAERRALERCGASLEAILQFALRAFQAGGTDRGAELQFTAGSCWRWLAADANGSVVGAEGPREALRIVQVHPSPHARGGDHLTETWHVMLQSLAARGVVRSWRLSGRGGFAKSWGKLLATVESDETASAVASVLFLSGRSEADVPGSIEKRPLPRHLVDEATDIETIECCKSRVAASVRDWTHLNEDEAEEVERDVAGSLDAIDTVLVRRKGARALGFSLEGPEPSLSWLAEYQHVLRRLSHERPPRPQAWSAWAFVPPPRPRNSAAVWMRPVVRTAWDEGGDAEVLFAKEMIEREPEARRVYERSRLGAERWLAALQSAADEVWAKVVEDLRASVPAGAFDARIRPLRLRAESNRVVRVVSNDPEQLRSAELDYGDLVRRAIRRKLGNIDIEFG
jgi:hypothetical protein